MVHFSVMDYSLQDEVVKEHWDSPLYADHWHFPQFRKALIPYILASNCDEVELYLNGKRYVLPKPSECPNRLITGFLPWQPGTVKVVGYRNGEAVCKHMTVTPGPAVRLEFDQLGAGYGQRLSGQAEGKCEVRPFAQAEAGCRQMLSAQADVDCGEMAFGQPDGETSYIRVQEGYETLLTVRAVDGEGHPCFRESTRVRFQVEGPAEILAVDNGDITSNEPYGESSIHLYRGTASVRIAFTGESGRVMVYADGEGIFSGQCLIVL